METGGGDGGGGGYRLFLVLVLGSWFLILVVVFVGVYFLCFLLFCSSAIIRTHPSIPISISSPKSVLYIPCQQPGARFTSRIDVLFNV